MLHSDHKNIAKNTAYLYLRKIFTLAIALYTSRRLLEQLGVDDFGTYGLVGSIVAIFSALRGLFATAVQRFINIAKGKGGSNEVNRIFCIGVKIHLWIALIFFVVVEISGFCVMPHLNIPSENYYAALWVLQFSVLSAVVSILTVPYDALIIANERFDAYAIFSIIDVLLRLLVIIALSLFSTGRLVAFAAMLLGVAIVVRFMNMIYCRLQFGEEARFHNIKDPKQFREMTAFAGWQFFGNMGFTLTNNGLNFIINIFGGVVVNAARTIAYQVMSAVSQLTADISVSFRPRMMKLYAQGNRLEFSSLLHINAKASFTICITLAFPIFILAEPILSIWLNEVPVYATGFVQSILFYMLVRSIHSTIDISFSSAGKMKWYQLTEFAIMSLNLPASWLALHYHMPFTSVFMIMSAIELCSFVITSFLAKIQVDFDIKSFYKCVMAPIFFLMAVLTAITYAMEKWGHQLISPVGTWQTICTAAILCATTFALAFAIVFTKHERTKFMQLLPLTNRFFKK